MVSIRLVNERYEPTTLGAVILWLSAIAATGAVTVNGYVYIKNRPKPQTVLPLESDAVDARRYGEGYTNEDRDHNGARESYFTDPVTGKEHRIRINHATGELTYKLIE